MTGIVGKVDIVSLKIILWDAESTDDGTMEMVIPVSDIVTIEQIK